MSKRPTDDDEPSAKRGKRGNERQLTKDDASEDSDDVSLDDWPSLLSCLPLLSWHSNLCVLQEIAGEIKKASAETMKARRVVRARRPPAVAAPAPAGANPFAAINLFQPPAAAAPVQTSTAPPAASTAVKVRMIKQQVNEGHKREDMLICCCPAGCACRASQPS